MTRAQKQARHRFLPRTLGRWLVHLSYDKMASFLAPYANAAAQEVARELDRKVEKILQQAAA